MGAVVLTADDQTVKPSLPFPCAGVGGTNRERGSGRGGGGWRVLLIKSDKHEEQRVVKAITRVVPNCDETHAKVTTHARTRV